MKKVIFTLLLSALVVRSFSQAFTPVSVTGFNLDAVAEAFPNSLATTTQALDQVVAGGNSVMYSAAFATAASFSGGLPNSGAIVNGLKSYQLMPYTGNNALFAPASSSNTLTLTTPASYSSVSFLVFSTEGSSSINLVINYTDLTSTNAGTFTVQDWFNGSGAIISGIGRCKRVASGVTNDGLPTNPRLYGIDVNLTCANQQKLISSITVNGVTSNPAGGGGYVLAISGVAANVTPPVVAYASNLFCQTGASATPTVTGATGGTFSSAPAGLSIISGSGIINMNASAPNTYTVTYTTTGTCSLITTYTLTVSPTPTISVTSPTVCWGSVATIAASGAASYVWSPATGLNSTTGSFVNASVGSTSVYTVTGTTTAGCTAFNTTTVTVNSLPTIVADNAAICPGQTATLGSTVSIPGGTYTWLPNGETSSSITGSPSTATSYTVLYSVNGCSTSAVAGIAINPIPVLSVNSGSVCSGQPIVLNATANSTGGTYSWLPGGETSPAITTSPTTPSTYTVTYSLNGCSASAVSNVAINANPALILTPSVPSIAPLDEVSIVASGGDSYVWSTGATGSSITVKPLETTTFCATLTTVYGCKSENCVEIVVKDESTLYVPNVFTPNGDGVNDIFYIPGYNLVSFDMKIYNRWGQLLFETTDPQQGWDGSYKGVIVPGVYVFILKAKGTDNSDYKKTGHITLLQ